MKKRSNEEMCSVSRLFLHIEVNDSVDYIFIFHSLM